MTKIFVTGATGYIGGDLLYTIANAHPEYEYTCLVRNSDKGALIASQYPKIRLVYGTLDSFALIAEEVGNADIVIHTADSSDHIGAANAISTGFSTHTAQNPGYWIHTSGTGILTFADVKRNLFGESSTKIFTDDDTGIAELTSLPDAAWHRNVDKIVLATSAANSGNVKTAIVCPPTIYGDGRGPGNKRSQQVYELARVTLEQGHGVMVGNGLAAWPNVHIRDLSDVYLGLVEAAVAPGSHRATWDEKGYYIVENGEHVWGELARAVAKECKRQGLIDTDEVRSVSVEEADRFTQGGHITWGSNARARAVRAREVLGWMPEGATLMQELEGIVKGEAKRLGRVKGHAVVAAGEA